MADILRGVWLRDKDKYGYYRRMYPDGDSQSHKAGLDKLLGAARTNREMIITGSMYHHRRNLSSFNTSLTRHIFPHLTSLTIKSFRIQALQLGAYIYKHKSTLCRLQAANVELADGCWSNIFTTLQKLENLDDLKLAGLFQRRVILPCITNTLEPDMMCRLCPGIVIRGRDAIATFLVNAEKNFTVSTPAWRFITGQYQVDFHTLRNFGKLIDVTVVENGLAEPRLTDY